MKKFLIAVFSLCLVLCAVSCKNSSSNNETETADMPFIETEFKISYGVVNTKVDLPEYVAYLEGEHIDATAEMKDDNGATVDLANGFTPARAGEYVYTISAKNGEVEAKEKVYFYIEENSDYYKNKVASFDKPYGVNHFRQATGIELSYTTDYRYENQAGTTKVRVDSRKGGELYFSLGNFHIKDLTESKGLIFYVYNDNPGHINLYFNWTNAMLLKPRSWNKVYVNESGLQEFEKSYSQLIEDNFSLASIDGLEIELGQIAGAGSVYDLFFSALYTLDEDISIKIDTVEAAMNEFIISNYKSQEKIDEIESMYNALSHDDRPLVKNYNAFRNEVIDFYKKDIDLEEGKAIYFDDEIGLRQISNTVGASLKNSTLYKYGDEKSSTLIDVYGFDAQITIGYPFVDNIGCYDYLTIYFYNPTLTDYVLFNRIGGEDVVLKSKEWTEVNFELSDVETLNDAVIWIYSGDWYKGLEYGVKIYMSAAYLRHDGVFYSPEELVEIIDGITENASLEDLKPLQKNYNSYSDAQKALVGNYKKLADSIYYAIKRENSLLDENDKLLYFDSVAGLEQVTVEKASGAYTTAVKYGSEQGSTKFNVTGFDLLIHLNFVTSESNFYESAEFGVYNDNDYNIVFFPSFFVGDKQETVLAPKAWTTVTVNINGNAKFTDTILWFYSGDWHKGIEGATLYISSVKLNVGEMGEKLVDFTSADFADKLTADGIKSGEGVREGYAELYYNGEFGFGGESAAVKIVTRSFYSDIVIRDNASIMGCTQIRFAVYNANDARRKLIDLSSLSGAQTEIWMETNSWTVITLDISASRATVDGFVLRIYDGGGWGSISGNVFYLSDIYVLGRTAENATTLIDFSSNNIPVITSNAILSYDTEHKVGDEDGSLKLETKTNAQFFVDLTFNADVDVSEYKSIKFIIYSLCNGLEGNGALNIATRYLQTYDTLDANPATYELAKTCWTVVTVEFGENVTNLKDVVIRLFPSGYGNFNGEIFYIADIVGVK